MANLLGFTGGFNILGLGIRFHLEANTLYKIFDYELSYDEGLNGIRISLQLLGTQLMFGIGTNVQDLWFFDSSTYFLRQNQNLEDDFNIQNIENDEFYEGENYDSNENKSI